MCNNMEKEWTIDIGDQPKQINPRKSRDHYRGYETRLVDAAAVDRDNRESEPRIVIGQELGSTAVESDGGSDETKSSTSLVDNGALRELADHEEEEGQVEEEEEKNQDEVHPQRCQEEDECEDEPGSQKDPNSASELPGVIGIRSSDAEAGMKEGSVGQPETAI